MYGNIMGFPVFFYIYLYALESEAIYLRESALSHAGMTIRVIHNYLYYGQVHNS